MTNETLEIILFGDDNASMFKLPVKKRFPEYTIEFYCTPEEIIEKAKQGKFKTIITDLNYTKGGEEGFNVLSEVKGCSDIRILHTGIFRGEEAKMMETAGRYGATHVVSKNDYETLRKIIERR